MTPVILLLFLLSHPLFSDSLQEARSWEEKADYPRALAAYRSWLRENPGTADFLPNLFRAARLSPNPEAAASLLEDFLPLAPPQKAAEVLARKADFLELGGDYTGAQAALEEASRRSSGEESLSCLLRSAELLLETGELDKSRDQARTVATRSADPHLKKRGVFHLARLFAASGDLAEALRLSTALTEDRNNRKGNEVILLFSFNLARQLGREEEKKAIYRRLEAEYPQSPELGLAQDDLKGVKPFPTPSAILSPPGMADIRSSPAPAVPGAGPEAAGPPSSAQVSPAPPSPHQTPSRLQPPPRKEPPAQRPWAVQTGSFSVRENARYMARDLEGLGFSALVRDEVRPDGRTMYKVLIPLAPGEEGEEGTQNLLIRLKEKGIEGFLIFAEGDS